MGILGPFKKHGKRAEKEANEALRSKMEEVLKGCAPQIKKLDECDHHGKALYEIILKCRKQMKELEICLDQYSLGSSRNEAVSEERKMEDKLHPKGGKGPAER